MPCRGQQLRMGSRHSVTSRVHSPNSQGSGVHNHPPAGRGALATNRRRDVGRPPSAFPFCSLPQWAPCTIQRTSGLPRPRGDRRDEYPSPTHFVPGRYSGTIRGNNVEPPCRWRRRLRDGVANLLGHLQRMAKVTLRHGARIVEKLGGSELDRPSGVGSRTRREGRTGVARRSGLMPRRPRPGKTSVR
jgi:hypothetical protein